MKQIKLLNGMFAKVDDEDYDELTRHKWSAVHKKSSENFYARRTKMVNGKRVHIWMHREIMSTPIDMVCDHIHHDTLDNQKSELRNCTLSQNVRNKKKPIKNNSGVEGVYLNKNTKRYQVRINVGSYATAEEAFEARRIAEIKIFGDEL